MNRNTELFCIVTICSNPSTLKKKYLTECYGDKLIFASRNGYFFVQKYYPEN